MIKIIGCLIILTVSTMGGFIYSEGFRKRVRQLNEFERAVNQLQNEIEYTYTPLPEAFRNVAEKSENPIKDIFEKVSAALYSNEAESVYETFQKYLLKGENQLYIDSEDIKVILDLSKSLGEADIEGHKKIFSLVRTNLKKRLEIAEKNMNKNVKLYRYLGFSIGAVIVIVLL